MRSALLATTLIATPASAEVLQTADTGFTTRHQLAIAAPREKVWATFLQPGRWWEGSHTYSGSSANMTIEPRAGGCWCEKTADGGSIEHMHLVYAQPHRTLRFLGGLGPLQAMPVQGVLTMELKPVGAGTEVTITYAVGGASPGGWAKIAPLVDQVLGAQWPLLKKAAEAS